MTLMTGGAISGYCATGRRKNATPPRITNTIETHGGEDRPVDEEMRNAHALTPSVISTVAADLPPGRPRRLGALLLRRAPSGPGAPHQTVDDDAIVGPEPVLDDAQIVGRQLAERDIFLPRRVLLVDHDDEFARLLGADRGVRNQQRLVRRRARHAHAREHARREHAVGICEHSAAADRAGRAVDHVVDEVHAALVVEIALVDQLERDRDAGVAAGDVLAFASPAARSEDTRLHRR